MGGTTVSAFWESRHDRQRQLHVRRRHERRRAARNDLIYIPRDQSEMNFVAFAAGGRTFTRRSRRRRSTPTSSRTNT